MATTLWLARHAQPLIEAGLCYGQTDIAADTQATALCAQQLARALPKNTRVIASPLQRCEQLSHALLGLRPDLTFHTDARLQEMNFGNWENRPWQDIAPAELKAWTDDFAHQCAGGNGESVSQFMQRVAAAFDAVQRPGPTLWITHAGVIRAAELLASGTRQITRADQWPTAAPNYGQWCTLEI